MQTMLQLTGKSLEHLQSKAGNYECSVSGLRWICNGTVSFKYQFCSWEEHMKRMKSLQYMPAGPLMDITVVTGRFDEVHLPHWICIENNHRKTNNKILDKFAVLHINDCGDDVEKVSQVTSSHVKLSEPVFSPRAVLLRMGIPVRINCNVLIYKTNTAFLTLHVYLIPRDPGLQQEMDRRQISDGYKVIKKPQPNTSLKMNDRFILTAVLKGAEITPEDLKLRCGSSPNFYEVYSQNPDTDFELVLNHKKDHQTVWKRTIRKDEYQSIDHIHAATPSAGAAGVNTTAPDGSAEKHFVDEHRTALIDRVTNVAAILDDLLDGEVISKGSYEEIMALSTRRDQMRKLFSGPLDGSGRAGKDLFYKILEKKEKFLMKDLQKKE
uniref:CARD domain-containing protein n=1 Tax=Gasterosteus aculeatus aculeatus TaxID=481459 RepID=G3PFF1_GASAC